MSKETALHNVLNRKKNIHSVQVRAAKSRDKFLRLEREAIEDLENLVAFLLATREVTETAVARALGYSRDRVRGMVKRANERNMKLMRGELND